MLAKRVREQLKEKEAALAEKLKKAAEDEQQGALSILREELDEKSKQVQELNKASAELEKVKREKNELGDKLKAEAEKQLSERLAAERLKIAKEESGKNELKLKELEKQLEDQKKLTEEMKRKQEQGSMQTQGEVQEMGIEEWLAEKFPLDVIQEIKELIKMGYDHFHLCDAEFNENILYCVNLLQSIVNEKLKFKWALYMKPINYSQKMLELLKKTGA